MHKKALISLSVLFFMMGFITCLNDLLVPYLKAIFHLSYSQAALVQFCFFAAYGLTALPASQLVARMGYQKGMVIGFALAALGCLMFYPAVLLHTYALFLAALFVLASGIVLLQVAANPCVALIGPAATAPARLTMVQAFNSLGTFLAPFFGAVFILATLSVAGDPQAVIYPYLGIAWVLIMIAIALSTLPLAMPSVQVGNRILWQQLLASSQLSSGMLGIFAYVGAEVAIGSFLVNYVKELTQMPETQAATLVAVYWGGAMLGRFVGIFTLRAFAPVKVLITHAGLSMLCILISMQGTGLLAVVSMVLVGLCNSIMFPTIFTLAIQRMPDGTQETASGLLATAIVGGAVVPFFTGVLADQVGLQMAFGLPLLCYAYIAWWGNRQRT